ncbi:hypothetical protein ABZ621_21760 [Streptomyces sp. NPDC007863]|uniref:hypothetical protein n=1 Tax=Streptomyces sp. NPDC007863 TaxID=3154894 RepID=UPI0034024E16
MVSVERVMVVRRPWAEVVAYLEDFARTEEWDTGTVRCVRLDDGPVRPGARWRNTPRLAAPFLRGEFEGLAGGAVTRLPAAAEAWRP